jgi:hypothetical protein
VHSWATQYFQRDRGASRSLCTPVEGTADLEGLVHLAVSIDTFEKQLLAALAEQDISVVQRRQAYAYGDSWQARIEIIKEIMMENNVIEF